MVAVASLTSIPLIGLLPAFARYKLSANAVEFGFLSTFFGIGAVIGALALALLAVKRVHYLTLRVGYFFFITAILVFSQTRSFPMASVALAIAGFGFSFAFPSTNSIIQLKVPDELRGRVMGVYSQLFVGLYPIGTLLLGWLGSVIGVDRAILLGAIVSGVFAIFLLSNFGANKMDKSTHLA